MNEEISKLLDALIEEAREWDIFFPAHPVGFVPPRDYFDGVRARLEANDEG